jgi:glycosyltransferase involved in cell wall biosynthesis
MPRRVLILAYYFPPAGGSAVQRALSFAKYLPEHGWQPTILTLRPEHAAYPDRDERLLDEVPPTTPVERTRGWDPYAAYARLLGRDKDDAVGVGFVGEGTPNWKQRLARWIRANIFLPDARIGWVPFAVRRGLALLREGACEAVLTTGPPHSTHLAGLALSRFTKRPWIADFRDPWTEIDYAGELPMTGAARWLDAAMERHVLRSASAVTVVTPRWKRDLRQRAPGGHYRLLRNGYDPEAFAAPAEPQRDVFSITHLGNMNAARKSTVLWKALARLDAPRRLPKVRVRLVGNVDPVVLETARTLGVEGLVEQQPFVPHAEATRLMQRSALLLLAINRAANRMGIIPGKAYEYAAAGRPVLSIGPVEGDAAEVVREAQAGRTFGYEDVAGVARFLERHYEAWKQGESPAGAPTEAAEPFSRRAQSGALADLLGEVAGGC